VYLHPGICHISVIKISYGLARIAVNQNGAGDTNMINYSDTYRFDYFCGWRYLTSPAFRNRMRTRWGRSLWLRVLGYVGVFTSLLITTTAAVLALMTAWHLLVG
jgi:hypothetical protein